MSLTKRTRQFAARLEVRGPGDKDKNKRTIGGLLVPYGVRARLRSLGAVEVFEQFEAGGMTEYEDGAAYLVSHDHARAVARSPDTLSWSETEEGFHVEATVDTRDPDAAGLVNKIENGVFQGQSVGFIPLRESMEEERNEDGDLQSVTYTVHEWSFFEASAVTFPVYTESDLDLRRRSEIESTIKQDRGVLPQTRARTRRGLLLLARHGD